MASKKKRPPSPIEETPRKKQKTSAVTPGITKSNQENENNGASNDTAKSKQTEKLTAVTTTNESERPESNSEEDTTDTSEDESSTSGVTNKVPPPKISNIHTKSINPLNEVRVNPNAQYAMIIHKGENSVQVSTQGTVLAQIKRLQRSTRLCLPKSAFARLIKEISQKYGNYCFQSLALEAIQEAAELFTIGFISDSYLLTRHRQRQTLSAEDMQLLNNLLCDHVPSLQRN